MRFTLTFKQNDVFDQLDFLKEDGDEGLDKFLECKRFAEKYVSYGEYIRIEFDTVSGDAFPVKR